MVTEIGTFFQYFYLAIPDTYRSLINVIGLAIIITIYSLLTWKFYKLIAHKDILKLDLSKYNQSEHPFLSRFFGIILYILEYIIILPFIIFVWFAVLALVIFFITKEASLITTLQVTAAIVAAIRILSYYRQEIAEEIAKLLPLAVLIVVITEGNFNLFDRILSVWNEIPPFASTILIYFGFIAVIELFMRFLEIIIGSDRD